MAEFKILDVHFDMYELVTFSINEKWMCREKNFWHKWQILRILSINFLLHRVWLYGVSLVFQPPWFSHHDTAYQDLSCEQALTREDYRAQHQNWPRASGYLCGYKQTKTSMSQAWNFNFWEGKAWPFSFCNRALSFENLKVYGKFLKGH